MLFQVRVRWHWRGCECVHVCCIRKRYLYKYRVLWGWWIVLSIRVDRSWIVAAPLLSLKTSMWLVTKIPQQNVETVLFWNWLIELHPFKKMFYVLIENFKFAFEFQKEVEVYKSICLQYWLLCSINCTH